MKFIGQWYRRNINGTPEQLKIFLCFIPVFLFVSFVIAKFFPIASFIWTIIYSAGFLTAYVSSSTKERPAFPYASKFPRANAVAHSFYACWAIMGLFWLSLEESISGLFY